MGYGQCLLNNGAQMTLNNGVHVYLDGGSTAHYTNQNGGLITSTSSNAGTITVLGNWINNASNVAFSNDGSTVLMSGANQIIGGTNSSTFDNLILSGSGTKQLLVNTSVGGVILKSGSLDLTSRPLDLNSHTLTITNSLTTGIIKTSGYILSETPSTPGYGTIQWNIGNASGSYEFPFGSFSTTYIPLLMNVNTAGIQTSTGNISASTYPTTSSLSINNRPLPSGVADLNNNCSSEHATKMLDRFWVINSNNYSTKPISSMLFSYQDNEWDLTASSTNTITENKLKVWNYNTNWQGISTSSNNPSLNQQTLASTSNDGVFTLGEYNQLQLQLIKADSVKCLGQSNGVIQFSVSQSGYGNTSFAWNGVNSPDTIKSNLAAGIYTITAIDLMGCRDTLRNVSIKVEAYSNMGFANFNYVVNADDDIIDNMVEFKNTSINSHQFTWSFGYPTNKSYEKDPQHTFPEAGKYIVTLIAINKYGCVDSISKLVYIEETASIYIPNAFTPNQDGVNDTFQVVGINIKDLYLVIYNRWGEKIFESTNELKAWDGFYKDEVCKDDVYVYKVFYKLANGASKNLQKEKTGMVMLMK